MATDKSSSALLWQFAYSVKMLQRHGFCCSTARRSGAKAQHSTGHHTTAHHSTAQHSTAQHGTAPHSTAQHSTAQHSTAQQSAATHPMPALQQVAWGACMSRALGSWRQPHRGSSLGYWPLSKPTCCRPASAAKPLPGQRLLQSLRTLAPCCLLQRDTHTCLLIQCIMVLGDLDTLEYT